MQNKELEKIIYKLKESPLFYLFVSSRELFHSNFWFWLSTLNQNETLKIFSQKFTINTHPLFIREHNQSFDKIKSKVDLLINLDNNFKIVIENKVKDFPTTEQLDRIKLSFNNENTEFVLTTLFWTTDLNFDGWRVLTYKEISNNIDPEKFHGNEYFKKLIQDYKEFTFNLSDLAEIISVNQNYDFVYEFMPDLCGKLNDIKLWEGYLKLRASHLLNKFKTFNRHNLTTYYSVNNKKSTIDFTINLDDKYRIGIQIEGNQFRKFIQGQEGNQFADNLINDNLFFNTAFKGRDNKPYLNYGSAFKYQYEKLGSPITFVEFFNKVNNEFDFILDNIERIKRKIPNK